MEKKSFTRMGVDVCTVTFAIVIMTAVSLILVALEQNRYTATIEREKAEAVAILEDVRSGFQGTLIEGQLRAKGVATAVALSEQINEQVFTELGQRFRNENVSIVNVALIDGYKIAHVHPLAENSQLIGRDLSQLPSQKAVLDELYETNQPVLQGPLMLLQGMPGFIIRMPIPKEDYRFMQPFGADKGNISVVIDGNELLEAVIAARSGVAHDMDDFAISIKTSDGSVAVGDAIDVIENPISFRDTLFGADLEFLVVPKEGWGSTFRWGAATSALVVISGAVLIAFIFGFRRETRAKGLAQTRLSSALDCLPDAFVLFDKDDRLVVCNPPYLEMHKDYSDHIKPGITLYEILKLGIEHDMFPEAIGREEEWLAERSQKPGQNGRDIEVPFRGAKWYRVIEKLTADGGRVGLRMDITAQIDARIRAERAEKASETARRELVAAVETLPDGFVYYDADDRLVLCNSKYREIYALSAKAIQPGATFEEILRFGLTNGQYQDGLGREEEWLAERLADHEKSNSTVEQQLSDGTWLRIIERRTPDGGRVGLRIDITEQMNSRRRAEMAEQTLRDAINSLPAGFRLFDADGKLAAYNDYYLKLYEASASSIRIGSSPQEILEAGLAHGEYPEAVGREEKWLSEAIALEEADSYEWEYPLKSGRWVRSYGRTVSDGGRVGIQVDITELRNQQLALQEANDDLMKIMAERDAAERRFCHLSEISDDWFWEQDQNLRFTFVSDGFDRLMSRKSTELLGKTRYEIYKNDPEVMESGNWDWLKEREANREPFRNFVYRTSGREHEGEPRWIQISGAPIFDNNGRFLGYRGVGADISEYYSAMKDAEAANKAKTEFLNVMSHELRTPLTVVLGFNSFLRRPQMLKSVRKFKENLPENSELAADFDDVIEEVVKYANKMDVSGKHLLALINDMLDLAKIDSGNVSLDMHDLSLKEVTENVCTQFELAAQQKGLDLNIDIGIDGAFADEMKLKQVLINLIGNAVKFTDKGSVTVKARRYRGMVNVQVIDTGCGIAPDQKEQVFEQFKQVDSTVTRKLGGTGLGLAISRKLVEIMGGELTLTSVLGQGSTFAFTLQSARHVAETPETIEPYI